MTTRSSINVKLLERFARRALPRYANSSVSANGVCLCLLTAGSLMSVKRSVYREHAVELLSSRFGFLFLNCNGLISFRADFLHVVNAFRFIVIPHTRSARSQFVPGYAGGLSANQDHYAILSIPETRVKTAHRGNVAPALSQFSGGVERLIFPVPASVTFSQLFGLPSFRQRGLSARFH